MLRGGLIKDIIGLSGEIHMRTDANNLVTTASTTHVPEQQETIHMIQTLRKEASSGSIADLSHIRTQWCLAGCLTKKSANPQNLIDAVRSGILKEVDSHPPFRSLLEHKAYLRSWLPTVCSHVDFRLSDMMFFCWVIPWRILDYFLNLCLWLKKEGPEIRTVSTQPCLALIGGVNQQSRRHEAPKIQSLQFTARGSEDLKPTVPEEEPYRSEDSEYDYVPPEGYAARKSREVPHVPDRTIETRPQEDHMEFCFAFKQQCQRYNDKEYVTLLVERGIHAINGPANMSPFCRRQMAMDSVSWCLFWEKPHEFDHFLRFQADLIPHVTCSWLVFPR